ncbi:hypothetical protein [Emticicia sp. SJ17W-69]|uniref:hypothetical protein n=1 Tax=Emticicia sp. SJ17W-69 TaxID=3421657 RepID=UPI003EB84EE2
MKKYIFILSIIVLTSCENFPGVSFDFNSDMTFVIDKPGLQYDGSKLLDPTTNETFKKNSDKLKDVTVTKVTYTISDFVGTTSQTASASFDAADGNGNNKTNIGSFSNVNLSSLVGKETEITASPAAIIALAGFMKTSPYKVNVYYTGSVNQAPVKFTLKLKVYAKAKAKVI